MKFPYQTSQFLQQQVSFAQWQQQVALYRDFFISQPQQRWLIFFEDSYQFTCYFFALIAANKQVILPPNGQPLQIVQCMEHADIFLGELSGLNNTDTSSDYLTFNLSQLEDDIKQPVDLTNNPLSFDKHCQLVFFTSGSSGQAKAIEKTFEQLIIEVEQLELTFAKLLDTKQSNSSVPVVMATVSHQHIYGLLFKVLWPIWSGRDLYLKTFAYPEHLVHEIKQHPKTNIWLISSPAYYHRLLADNVLVEVKEQLQALFSSGGPLNSEAAIAIKDSLLKSPIEVFGSTETGGIAWRQRATAQDDVWHVFSGITCKSSHDEQCLAILSPYVDASTWYQTQDRVELIDKQRFKLLGRADRIVKIEEKRCSLDEIGLRLGEHPWVEQAFVLVIDAQGHRRTLAAVVELTTTGKEVFAASSKFTFDKQLKAHLKQYFEAIVVPRKFRYLDCLPYNSQGKLNKKQLETLFD
ncbi:AMP-binding protein [Litorilituus lipolyticus]|uniref:Long-chain fatty acid--CoA ligase n=1 Tax=Litorilituus lipolyticus TaxID=2491017 RepID=A0A502KLU9_9GAMM|nr:class I adenylate-forming enzyme family protein [Litorilituus lipolyticus]TPH12234.1 long-chain fatty acid--CoA ligase [Litorilituus lipolyticus]